MHIFKLQSKAQKIGLTLFLVIFGAGGVVLVGLSLAGSQPNPIGFADFCSLEGSNTVIYGWAHDEDASVGGAPTVVVRLSSGQSVTVATDRTYRQSQIDQYVSARGYATSSLYGFRAQFSGVYKGSSSTLSGTINNVGVGSNIALGINTYGPVDGGPLPYFPGSKIPDSCLATRPPATTTPTPKPAPRPAPVSAPTSPAISFDANAIVTPATLSANFVVPAGNAAFVRIGAGTVDGTFTLGSADTPPASGNATIKLGGLQPKTQYFYQINRLNADKTATVSSPSASFTTPGFDLQLTLADQTTPLGLHEVNINYQDFKGTTDDKGLITVKDMPLGTYTVAFSYKDKDYQKDITIATDSSELVDKEAPGAVVFRTTLDVANLTPIEVTRPPTTPLPEKKPSRAPLLIILFLVILAAAGGVFWFIRRRRQAQSNADEGIDLSSLGMNPAPPTNTQPPVPTQAPSLAGQANPAHVGESLKDMVIKSMHDEAARKSATNEQEPKEPRQ